MNSSLFSYLPQLFAELREFGIMFAALKNDDAIGALDTFAADAAQWHRNQFPTSDEMDDAGIIRWAKALRVYSPGKTQEELLFSVRTRLSERRPYNLQALKRILTDLVGEEGTDYDVTVDVPNQTVTVNLSLTSAFKYNDTVQMLQRIIPAHLLLIVQISYNTYGSLTANNKTHTDLANMMHKDIRSGTL